ncbi:MAG: OmpA family protein [Gammaproteobacteria bacterium]
MQSDLEKLKELLFGHEKKALDALTRRLDTAESRTADVADVLPGAIDLSVEQGPELSRSLKKPLEDTLTEAIVRDPHKFAVALYPVIGPAIRRAVAEAMKSLIMSINRGIDDAMSPVARFKARRAGIPLAEWVLRQSLVYRVDDVFLIDPRSGLLIEHVHHPEAGEKDEDAVSAMLTAIQDFGRDSFSDDGGDLSSASIGEFTVWISQGPYAMLAAVIRGTPPPDVRSLLDVTIERLHLSNGEALKNFQGGRIGNLEDELSQCLRLRLRQDAPVRRGPSRWPAVAVFALIACGVGYLIWQNVVRDRALERWRDALAAEPGIVTTQMRRDRDTFFAAGLRDPLAASPGDVAASSSLPEGSEIALDFRPFVSLEPSMIEARARTVLAPPERVSLSFDNGVLAARGDAPVQWRQRFETIALTVAGVKAVDSTGLGASDTELFARIIRITEPPDSVQVTVNSGVATFAGESPHAFVSTLAARLATVDGLRGSDLRQLVTTEERELKRLALAINDHRIFYNTSTNLVDAQQQGVRTLARKMVDYGRFAIVLGKTPSFRLTGFTDASGLPAANRQLRLARAQDTAARLALFGVNPDWLVIRSGPRSPAGSENDATQRNVRVEVTESTDSL